MIYVHPTEFIVAPFDGAFVLYRKNHNTPDYKETTFDNYKVFIHPSIEKYDLDKLKTGVNKILQRCKTTIKLDDI